MSTGDQDWDKVLEDVITAHAWEADRLAVAKAGGGYTTYNTKNNDEYGEPGTVRYENSCDVEDLGGGRYQVTSQFTRLLIRRPITALDRARSGSM